MHSNSGEPHVRSARIDILRGLAVAGMIAAHALFFFHNKQNPFLLSVESFLNTTVFTVFIFVFGLALSKWTDQHAHEHTRTVFWSSAKRAGILYIVYLAASSVAVLTASNPQNRTITDLIGAVSLLKPPNFTEYIPFFIFTVLLLPLLRPLFRHTKTSVLMTFLIGAFSYLAGITLYDMQIPGFLADIKALIAGNPGTLRFPFFQYFPVVLWGLWWQHDSDHVLSGNKRSSLHIILVVTAVSAALVGTVMTRTIHLPVLDPAVRWPPSVTFLLTGLSISAVSLMLMPGLAFLGKGIRQIVSYFGRDAFELWANHLILLFLYRALGGPQYADIFRISLLTIALTAASVALSSIALTNSIAFPLHLTFRGKTRFRKRHVLSAVLALAVLIWSQTAGTGSPYGNSMPTSPLTAGAIIPRNLTVRISSDRSWYTRRIPDNDSINLTVTVSGNEDADLSEDRFRILLNGSEHPFTGIAAEDGTLHFSAPVSDIPAGTYQVTAEVSGNIRYASEPLTIHISEPLLIAWTFDWEGWDAPESAISAMQEFSAGHPDVVFSHFISPRMFLPGVLPQYRDGRIRDFLLARSASGDELGTHLHMHYDLVEYAGVIPRTTNHWGLRSEEGYDVPTTEYTPDEFRTIVSYANEIIRNQGLPEMTGYRAGGWFISEAQLALLPELGYDYDSSGRNKPQTGAFRTTPWNLPPGAQPYFPSLQDQSAPAPDGQLLEIPINGLSTYDQDIDGLKAHIQEVYTGGVLTEPKALVFVSHPQFFTREFHKIPEMLAALSAVTRTADNGPGVFVTTRSIYDIWTLLHD